MGTNEWNSTQNEVRSAVWSTAWWKIGDNGTRALHLYTVGGLTLYILQVAPWHPVVSARGKYIVECEGRMVIRDGQSVHGTVVPHVFDTFEEAAAVFDLIKE